jgi:hypothetical protein
MLIIGKGDPAHSLEMKMIDQTALPPCEFAFDIGPAWSGFSHGSTWNGFDNVAVTKETLDKMIEWFRADAKDHGSSEEDAIGSFCDLEPMENGLYSLSFGFSTQIVETKQSLCDEYEAWCTKQGLPHMSADELIYEEVTEEQRTYLAAFSERWNVVMDRNYP